MFYQFWLYMLFVITVMASKYCMAGFNLTYSGLPTEDFEEFGRQFDAYAKLANHLEDKQALSFQTRLVGNALLFFNSLSQETQGNLESVKLALKDHFQGADWKWQIETKLLSRQQGQHETIDDFAADIMKLGAQLKKSGEDQISYFVRGLLPVYGQFRTKVNH